MRYTMNKVPPAPFPTWMANVVEIDRENRMIKAYMAPGALSEAENVGVVVNGGESWLYQIFVSPIHDFDEVLEWMRDLETKKTMNEEPTQ